MVKKKSCAGKGFKHNGKCYKYKVYIFPPKGKKRVRYTNKLSDTMRV